MTCDNLHPGEETGLRAIMLECKKRSSESEARHKPDEAQPDCNLYSIHQHLADQVAGDERNPPLEAHIILRFLSLNLPW